MPGKVLPFWAFGRLAEFPINGGATGRLQHWQAARLRSPGKVVQLRAFVYIAWVPIMKQQQATSSAG